MMTLICAMTFSLLLCLLLVPVVRTLAARMGLVDQPDGHRKMHKKATPVSGGLAVLLAAVTAVAAVTFVPNPLREAMWSMAGCCSACCSAAWRSCAWAWRMTSEAARPTQAVGPDRRDLHRFVFRRLGGARANLRLEHRTRLGRHPGDALPFARSNQFPESDRRDGRVASSVGVILSLVLAAMAMLTGHVWAAAVAVALAGALVGFLL